MFNFLCPFRRTPAIAILWVVLTVALAGCSGGGPELGYLTGTVTLDGTPVKGAVVTFLPKDQTKGTTSFGETDDKGEFKLMFTFQKEGVLLGTHDVKIEKPQFAPADAAETRAQGTSVSASGRIPGKFARRGELTAEVKPGRQVIDFALQSR